MLAGCSLTTQLTRSLAHAARMVSTRDVLALTHQPPGTADLCIDVAADRLHADRPKPLAELIGIGPGREHAIGRGVERARHAQDETAS